MRIYLSLGSNIGDRLENLRKAGAHFEISEQSSVYETEPVDYTDQPWFLNVVLSITTSRSPQQLLRFCQRIESEMGRTREIPKGPRTIDVDILFYGSLIVDDPGLQIPHPRIPDRRFVLQPLVEIAPDFIHPALNKSVRQMLHECTDSSVVRIWRLPEK